MTHSDPKAQMRINEQLLRDAAAKMDPQRYQEIRDAYYDAIIGLRSLAEALQLELAEHPGPASDLLTTEHLQACAALEAMNKSQLGFVL